MFLAKKIKNKLLLPSDLRPLIEEEAYSDLRPYIEAVEATSRISYKSIYIIDYHKMNFLYMSDNSLFLCGEKAEEVLRKGYRFYFSHVPKDDLKFLADVNQAGFDFFRDITIANRARCSISFNFHLYQDKRSDKVLINHQITPLKLDRAGNIWLALCVVSLAPSQETGVAYITRIDTNCMWKLTRKSLGWKDVESVVLSEHEKSNYE